MDTYIGVGENVQKLNFCIVDCKFCVCLLIVRFVVNFVQDSLIMFWRNHLPDSLWWRAVRWMEIGLSQADVARHLNVSHSVVPQLRNQFQTTDSVSRRPVPSQPRVMTPAEDLSSTFDSK